MVNSNLTLASLIGSRICHDLISPIGAIGNGLELIGMSGSGGGMEMDLIARSAEQARARIAFYRLAFGHGAGQDVSRREMVAVFEDLLAGGRLSCTWAIDGPAPRAGVRLACLAFMCCESALPYGGTVRIDMDADRWQVLGEGARLKIDEALWPALTEGRALSDVAAAQVQFALLPEVARDSGRALTVIRGDGHIGLRF